MIIFKYLFFTNCKYKSPIRPTVAKLLFFRIFASFFLFLAKEKNCGKCVDFLVRLGSCQGSAAAFFVSSCKMGGQSLAAYHSTRGRGGFWRLVAKSARPIRSAPGRLNSGDGPYSTHSRKNNKKKKNFCFPFLKLKDDTALSHTQHTQLTVLLF